MILHRLGRLLGAVLLLVPSLAMGQSALQQPNVAASPGVTVDPLPTAFTKLYQNDLFLQNLIAGRFNTLGAAALLNVGTIAGTVADGGALTAEITRAQAAESANATSIANLAPIASPAFTGVPTAPTAAGGTNTTQLATTAFVQNAVSGGGISAVLYTGQTLTAQNQFQARTNINAAVSGANTDITSLNAPALGAATAATAAPGTNTAQVANTAFVSANFAPVASPAFTGTPTAPTATAGTSSTQIATTAFLASALGSPFDLLSADSTVASAATTDIGAATTRRVAISGTTTITSFGTRPNRERLIRFAGALTLTYNATSLILPGAANVVTAAGDTAIATSDASGNWTVREYQRANGKPLLSKASIFQASGSIANFSQTAAWEDDLSLTFTATSPVVSARADTQFAHGNATSTALFTRVQLRDSSNTVLATGFAPQGYGINAQPITLSAPLLFSGLTEGVTYTLVLQNYRAQAVGPTTASMALGGSCL